jgi:hypothetical protein
MSVSRDWLKEQLEMADMHANDKPDKRVTVRLSGL